MLGQRAGLNWLGRGPLLLGCMLHGLHGEGGGGGGCSCFGAGDKGGVLYTATVAAQLLAKARARRGTGLHSCTQTPCSMPSPRWALVGSMLW